MSSHNGTPQPPIPPVQIPSQRDHDAGIFSPGDPMLNAWLDAGAMPIGAVVAGMQAMWGWSPAETEALMAEHGEDMEKWGRPTTIVAWKAVHAYVLRKSASPIASARGVVLPR